ncbi:cell death protein 3-like [Styela clava]
MSHGRTDEDGRLDVLVGNDDSTVNVNELVGSFKSDRNPHLEHTPVMMFFQMCRGSLADRRGDHYKRVQQHGVRSSVRNDTTDSNDDDQWLRNVLSTILPDGIFIGLQNQDDEDVADANPVGPSETVNVPDETGSEHIGNEPNMLISFSTMEGYKSFRNEGEGSWFIQAICDVFREHAHDEDIIALMKRVHIKVNGRVARSSSRQLDGCRVCSRTTHSFGDKKLYLFPGLP